MNEARGVAGRILVIGDGAWGTAMAMIIAGKGRRVTMWGHDPAYLDVMRQSRENTHFLPGITLPDGITFEPDRDRAAEGVELAISAVPTKFLRHVLAAWKGRLEPTAIVVSLTKGLETGTLARPSEIVRQCLGVKRVAAVSGPSHAEEVARKLPTTVVAAAADIETARSVQHALSTERFRIYAARDIIGVETAGALKNVIALAAGICHGLGLGDNALSALATRGLAEMTRLGVALGGETSTFAGLAGMGDLITTCVSPHSRNKAVGIMLAQGKTPADIAAAIPGVAEGVTTTDSALELAERLNVDMPITAEVANVLRHGKSPLRAVTDLMTRAQKDED